MKAAARSIVGSLIMAAVLVTGCADIPTDTAATETAANGTAATDSESDGDAPGPTVVPAGMGSPGVADGKFPRTVGHFGGSTDISAEPTRIVVIATGQLDAVLTLGVVPVAAAYGDGADPVPEYLSREFPQFTEAMDDFVDIGSRLDPNVEAIAAAKPDLILGNKAGQEDLYGTLSAIAPTVLTEGTGVNWKQDFLLIADALGRTDRAQSYFDGYRTRTNDVGDAAAAADSPTVSLVRFTADRARVFGVPSFAGYIAWDARLNRPESQQFDKTSQDFSEEEIQLANADWVFVGTQGSDGAAFTSNPLWTSMSASVNGRVVGVEDDPWFLNAGPTAATLVLDTLADTLNG